MIALLVTKYTEIVQRSLDDDARIQQFAAMTGQTTSYRRCCPVFIYPNLPEVHTALQLTTKEPWPISARILSADRRARATDVRVTLQAMVASMTPLPPNHKLLWPQTWEYVLQTDSPLFSFPYGHFPIYKTSRNV